jgi:hypothetical protein
MIAAMSVLMQTPITSSVPALADSLIADLDALLQQKGHR